MCRVTSDILTINRLALARLGKGFWIRYLVDALNSLEASRPQTLLISLSSSLQSLQSL